jgi:hypothetical protein
MNLDALIISYVVDQVAKAILENLASIYRFKMI